MIEINTINIKFKYSKFEFNRNLPFKLISTDLSLKKSIHKLIYIMHNIYIVFSFFFILSMQNLKYSFSESFNDLHKTVAKEILPVNNCS